MSDLGERNRCEPAQARSAWLLGFGLAIGVVAALLVARKRTRHGMPHRATWREALGAHLGRQAADTVLARVQARYAALLARHPRPDHPALRYHLMDNILPGLALYETLLETHDQDSALAAVDAAFAADVAHSRVRRLQMAALRWLPAPFAIFRLGARQAMRAYPAEGWTCEPVEDSAESYAFNMRTCFYLDTLRRYGAPELVPVFCKGDDRLFAELPPSIAWERRRTLGRGDALCDFRWSRTSNRELRIA